MSEKVLGFKEKDLSRIKFSDTSKIFVRVPESSLISVVSVEWLDSWIEKHRYHREDIKWCIPADQLKEDAKKEAGKK